MVDPTPRSSLLLGRSEGYWLRVDICNAYAGIERIAIDERRDTRNLPLGKYALRKPTVTQASPHFRRAIEVDIRFIANILVTTSDFNQKRNGFFGVASLDPDDASPPGIV